MRVSLPRSYSGNEIIAAFMAASTIEYNGRRLKWIPNEFAGEAEYELDTVLNIPRRIVHMGVKVMLHRWEREARTFPFLVANGWGWFPAGGPGWGDYAGYAPPQLRLLPLRKDAVHKVVHIRVGKDGDGGVVANDDIGNILVRFYARLQSPAPIAPSV